jgi:hypothetical protein
MLHRLHGWQRLPLPYEQGDDAPRRIGLGKATPRLEFSLHNQQGKRYLTRH